MDPCQFELDGIIVDDEQPSSFPDRRQERGWLGQVGVNGVNEATRFDRLHEQGRKPMLAPRRLVETAEETGERQNRQLGPARKGTQAAEQFESVHVRKNEVLEDEVWQGPPGLSQSRSRVGRLDHSVALGRKGDAQHFAGGRVVLDDENRGDGRHSPAPRSTTRARCSATILARASVSIGFDI